MTTTFNARRLLNRIVTTQALIFIVCLVNFIARAIEVERLDREIRAYGYVEHWYPGRIMVEPFLLLVAGALLLFNRWWALSVAVLASVRVVYSLGYLPWLSIHYAHDVPLFSSQALAKLWHVVYKLHPEYLFEVALGVAVFICASVLLARIRFRRSAVATVGG